MRNDVSRLLGVDSRYALDRLDLTVDSTINREVQRMVTDTLLRIRNKADAREMGLPTARTCCARATTPLGSWPASRCSSAWQRRPGCGCRPITSTSRSISTPARG